MSEIVLYGSRLSPFVEKAWRGLTCKGLEFELRPITNPLQLLRINPVTRKMPAATFDGELVYDSTYILRRAQELAPDPPLYAADPASAAEQRRLEDWADEMLYWVGMAFRFLPRNAGASAAQVLGTTALPGFAKALMAPAIKRQIGGMIRAQGMGRLPEEKLLEELETALDDLVTTLGGGAFFTGERPGAADFAVHGQLCMLKSGPTPEAAERVAARPLLVDFAKRVEDASGG